MAWVASVGALALATAVDMLAPSFSTEFGPKRLGWMVDYSHLALWVSLTWGTWRLASDLVRPSLFRGLVWLVALGSSLIGSFVVIETVAPKSKDSTSHRTESRLLLPSPPQITIQPIEMPRLDPETLKALQEIKIDPPPESRPLSEQLRDVQRKLPHIRADKSDSTASSPAASPRRRVSKRAAEESEP